MPSVEVAGGAVKRKKLGSWRGFQPGPTRESMMSSRPPGQANSKVDKNLTSDRLNRGHPGDLGPGGEGGNAVRGNPLNQQSLRWKGRGCPRATSGAASKEKGLGCFSELPVLLLHLTTPEHDQPLLVAATAP